MTLFIVKIAPKQRSIHEKFVGIVGKISLKKGEYVSVIQSITRHQASRNLSSDTNQPAPITLNIH